MDASTDFTPKKATPPSPPPPGPIRLTKAKSQGASHNMLLEAGDLVVAVNGILWSRLASVRKAISNLVENDAGPVLLTIWRKGQVFNVFTDTPLDGKWKVLEEPEVSQLEGIKPTKLPKDNKRLARFVIYAGSGSEAEVVELRRSFWAMLVPPFWLIFHAQWEALVGLLCVLLTAFVINPWFGTALYLAICVYVGSRQISLLQFAMTREGKRKIMVLAAASDLEAQDVALRFDEKLQFKFAPRAANVSDDVDIGLI